MISCWRILEVNATAVHLFPIAKLKWIKTTDGHYNWINFTYPPIVQLHIVDGERSWIGDRDEIRSRSKWVHVRPEQRLGEWSSTHVVAAMHGNRKMMYHERNVQLEFANKIIVWFNSCEEIVEDWARFIWVVKFDDCQILHNRNTIHAPGAVLLMNIVNTYVHIPKLFNIMKDLTCAKRNNATKKNTSKIQFNAIKIMGIPFHRCALNATFSVSLFDGLWNRRSLIVEIVLRWAQCSSSCNVAMAERFKRHQCMPSIC